MYAVDKPIILHEEKRGAAEMFAPPHDPQRATDEVVQDLLSRDVESSYLGKNIAHCTSYSTTGTGCLRCSCEKAVICAHPFSRVVASLSEREICLAQLLARSCVHDSAG